MTVCADGFRELRGVGASRRAVGITVDGPHGAFGWVPATLCDLSADVPVGRLPMRSWGYTSIDPWAMTGEGEGTWFGTVGSAEVSLSF